MHGRVENEFCLVTDLSDDAESDDTEDVVSINQDAEDVTSTDLSEYLALYMCVVGNWPLKHCSLFYISLVIVCMHMSSTPKVFRNNCS